MNCLNCGCDIGSNLGLCDECRNNRIKARAQSTCADDRPVSEGKTNPFVFIFVIPMLLALCVGVVYSALKPDHYAVSGSESVITIHTGYKETTLIYALTKKMSLTGHYYDYEWVDKNFYRQSGVRSQVAFLSSEDYSRLKQKYLSTGGCPASFLNNHVKMLFMVQPDSPSGESLVKAKFSRDERVKIDGYELHFREGTFDGKPYNGVRVSNAMFLYPTEIVRLGTEESH